MTEKPLRSYQHNNQSNTPVNFNQKHSWLLHYYSIKNTRVCHPFWPLLYIYIYIYLFIKEKDCFSNLGDRDKKERVRERQTDRQTDRQ